MENNKLNFPRNRNVRKQNEEVIHRDKTSIIMMPFYTGPTRALDIRIYRYIMWVPIV